MTPVRRRVQPRKLLTVFAINCTHLGRPVVVPAVGAVHVPVPTASTTKTANTPPPAAALIRVWRVEEGK